MAEPGTTSLCPLLATGPDTTVPSRGTRWTVRRVVAESAPGTLCVTAFIVVVASVTAFHVDVSFAAAAGIIATAPAVLVDVIEHRLPNRLVLGAACIATLAALATSLAGASMAWSDAFTGAALMTAPLAIVHIVAPHAMGFGDVKLALVLGFAVGLVHPTSALIALLIASAATATFGLVARRPSVAFGPGLSIGATAALVVAALGIGDFGRADEATTFFDHQIDTTVAEGTS